jgi:hypothetical protein
VALGDPEVKCKPAGRTEEAATVQAYGGVPPLAVTVVLYAELRVALASGLVVVMVNAPPDPELIVMLSAWVADCAGDSESVTLTVKEKVPAVVAGPAMTPFVDSDSPVGSIPLASVQVSGPTPPVAARVWL